MTTEKPKIVGRTLRLAVYFMLVASAGATFLLTDRLWQAARLGSLPMWAPLVPPLIFTAFVVVYTLDRWHLVRARSFPAARALFQVALAVTFLMLLWPQQASELRRSQQKSDAQGRSARLLSHGDEDVRAAACELLGLRGETELRERAATLAASDPSTAVRTACQEALARLGIARAIP